MKREELERMDIMVRLIGPVHVWTLRRGWPFKGVIEVVIDQDLTYTPHRLFIFHTFVDGKAIRTYTEVLDEKTLLEKWELDDTD